MCATLSSFLHRRQTMKIVWKVLLVLSFLFGSISFTDSLTCFVCQNCADPADLNGFVNDTCPGPCMRIRTTIPTMGTYIYKSCTKTCVEKQMYFGFSSMEVSCCSTDRCNDASTLTSAPSLWISLLVIVNFSR